MEKLQNFMNDVSQWADSAFGEHRKPVASIHHLKKEANELIEALENNDNPPNIREEFADCFIILLNAASNYGLTASEIMNLAEEKLAICKAREWGQPDENGVIEHIR